jgi:flagellar hook-associated protein 1 FlgK
LDEEMANVVNYQHAFQASARVISVIDEMLDTVVNELKK